MPFKRPYPKRSLVKYKKRFKKKGNPWMHLFKNITNRIYPYVRNCKVGTIYSDVSVITSGILNFRLSDLPGVADYGGLYDMYQLVMVDLNFLPIVTEANVTQVVTTAGPVGTEIPLFATCIDYDVFDTEPSPASMDEIRQYSRCQVRPSTKPIRWRFTPKLRGTVVKTFTSPSTYTYTNTTVGARWLDKADDATPYCGLKYCMQATGGSEPTQDSMYGYQIEAKYYIIFKNTR